MHCGVAYESVCSLARGHVIRVWGWPLTLVCQFEPSLFSAEPGNLLKTTRSSVTDMMDMPIHRPRMPPILDHRSTNVYDGTWIVLVTVISLK